MLLDTFSHNGKILPATQATVSLENLEYSYGYGVYETMKIRQGILYFTDLHIDRLLNSAQIIDLNHHFEAAFIKAALTHFNKHLNLKEPNLSCNLKILLIGNPAPNQANFYLLPLTPFYPNRNLYKEGATTGTIEYERWQPQAKTLNMLPSYIHYTQAKKQGWYDALLVNRKNKITEGTRTNFFTIRDRTIFCPPKTQILEGITQLTVLEIAKKNGYQIVENPISVDSLKNYDGAFFTSTSSKIIPIKQINDFIFPQITDPIKNLMQNYDDFLENCQGRFSF